MKYKAALQRRGRSFPQIAEKELHIWRASLRCERETLQGYEALLASEEKIRASRFVIPHAREDFVAARGILRVLLSGYVDREPSEVRFSYGAYGKPSVLAAEGVTAPQFNVSHSDGLAVFVFARSKQVGVDIERIRSDFAGEQIAELYFAEEEAAGLKTLPQERRGEAFFKYWTGKEAYLKARGEGLQTPLGSFRISIKKSEAQELVDERGSLWSLYSIEAGEGFAGAVVAEGKGWKLRYFQRQDGSFRSQEESALTENAMPEILATGGNDQKPRLNAYRGESAGN